MKTQYIFEDYEKSNISILFKSAFDESISKGIFTFSRGCGQIKNEASKLLQDGSSVIIYMDLVIDNKDTIKTYRTLRSTFNATHKVMILPIMCSEHQMIKSIRNHYELLNDIDEITKAITIDSTYNQTDLAKSNISYCKSFERYCKLVLMNNVKDCVNISKGRNGTNSNKLYMHYYTLDCNCKDSDSSCVSRNLEDKANELASEYPVTPMVKNGIIQQKQLSKREIYEIHKDRIDKYNRKVDEFKQNGLWASKVVAFDDWSV